MELTERQVKNLHECDLDELIGVWASIESKARAEGVMNEAVRMLCLVDRFYLLVQVCARVDMLNSFALARCREVEKAPDGYVDLWAREHYKSTIITYGGVLQDILKDPDITIGIFSHTRPIAKSFLRQIMRELESNKTLHAAFPDILWGENTRAAPKWSEDDGIIVKRRSNPNEATVEAWGLVDGQPTSKHFRVLLYDDVVVAGSVTTPEMIAKTLQEMERSYNLGTTPGIKRAVGTRWHFNDTYRTVIDRGTFIRREHPGREGGTEDGESVFWSDEIHAQKRRDMGPYTYAAQILLNPKADALQGFQREWLRKFKRIRHKDLNWYILVDAASSKKKASDYTAMWAVGLGLDGNYYIIPEVRDRLNLKQRGDRLFDLHRKYSDIGGKPVVQVRYERYGMMGDIEHFKTRMEAENYRFKIHEVAGKAGKLDRIRRLIPLFADGKMWLPETHMMTDWEKTTRDLVHDFIEEEFYPFPVALHDDMLDALARIAEPDMTLVWPKKAKKNDERVFNAYQDIQTAWMG